MQAKRRRKFYYLHSSLSVSQILYTSVIPLSKLLLHFLHLQGFNCWNLRGRGGGWDWLWEQQHLWISVTGTGGEENANIFTDNISWTPFGIGDISDCEVGKYIQAKFNSTPPNMNNYQQLKTKNLRCSGVHGPFDLVHNLGKEISNSLRNSVWNWTLNLLAAKLGYHQVAFLWAEQACREAAQWWQWVDFPSSCHILMGLGWVWGSKFGLKKPSITSGLHFKSLSPLANANCCLVYLSNRGGEACNNAVIYETGFATTNDS